MPGFEHDSATAITAAVVATTAAVVATAVATAIAATISDGYVNQHDGSDLPWYILVTVVMVVVIVAMMK